MIEEWECELCGEFFWENAEKMAGEENVICHSCNNSAEMEIDNE